jgi:amino acid adenylation domain-containing protein
MAAKGWEQAVAVLGILYAGGAYLPIDPGLPGERVRAILADGGVRFCVTQPGLNRTIAWPARMGRLVVEADCGGGPDPAPLEPVQAPADLAYVIYTSGSTGRPRGVMIEHRAAVNTILDVNQRFGIGPADRVLALSALGFDLSVYDLFGPLSVGGAVVLPAAGADRDPGHWGEVMRRERVTVWNSVPALMELLLGHVAGRPGVIAPSLRLALLSGDWIGVTLPDRLRSVAPGVRVVGLGGATEAAIWSIAHPVDVVDPMARSIPYGHPLTNQTVEVLDPALRPRPVWVPGRLFIGGAGLARGYWGDPDATAKRFIRHPVSGERLYDTGDRGRYLPDGSIEFLGRDDLQVKVGGHRIELGEVEAALAEHPAVRQAAVAAVGPPDARRLTGYVVPTNPVDLERADRLAATLRDHLLRKLPGYAVPPQITLLDALPLGANGKTDRRALAARRPPAPARAAVPVPDGKLERVLVDHLAALLPETTIDPAANFFELGATSLHLVRLHARLRGGIAPGLTVNDLFAHPSVRALAEYLNRETGGAGEPIARRTSAGPAGASEPIAIVGMACRFPGCRNPEDFWALTLSGRDAITRFTEDELRTTLDAEAVANPNLVRAGAVLDEIDLFDAAFFGIPSAEAERMDPQHRLFLEVAWEALEAAGVDPRAGTTGVFAGTNLSTYLLSNLDPATTLKIDGLPDLIGNDKDYLPAQVAYRLDCRGPAVGVQTACSSSLVAIHVACQALRNRECDVAIAGGAAINVPHRTGYVYQPGGPVSPSGVCRPFDAAASGTVLGNGVGAVVLKRLSEAVADGDVIDAVILGSAVNNDGARKVGLAAPSPEAQVAVIRAAVSSAGIDPRSVAYVEAHGAGTPVGDPVEAEALVRAYRPAGGSPLRVGSAKGSVGHLDSAAGVAGTIRTALALGRGTVPPTAGLSRPAPGVKAAGVKVAGQPARWPGAVRRAGVAGLGIGGTNAHLVMESPPERPSAPRPGPGPWLLAVSARSPLAARELARAYAGELHGDRALPVADFCYSAAVRKVHHPHRGAVVGRTAGELAAALDALASDVSSFSTDPAARPERPVFVFPGLGPRWYSLSRLLREDPVVADVIRQCDAILPRLGENWSVDATLRSPGQLARDPVAAQVSLFALQAGLVSAWRGLGVVPSAVVGHSAGEVAAAWACGALGLGEALGLAVRRGRALARSAGAGAMAAVGLSATETDEALARWRGRVTVAAENGPRLTVISGESAAVAEAVRELTGRGVWSKQLATGRVAGHSQLLEPYRAEFQAALSDLQPQPGSVPLYSTVTGRRLPGDHLTAEYWGRNLRDRVEFAATTAELIRAGHHLFVEISPHPALATSITELLAGADGVALPSLRRSEDPRTVRLATIAGLYTHGAGIDWAKVYPARRPLVRLPSYPWQRQRYWIERRPTPKATTTDHPLLGSPVSSGDEIRFTLNLRADLPGLAGHRVQNRQVVPASAFIESALAAGVRVLGSGPIAVADLVVHEPMVFPEVGSPAAELVCSARGAQTGAFRICAAADGSERVHAAGVVRSEPDVAGDEHAGLDELRARLTRRVESAAIYDRFRDEGVDYGPAFRGIRELWTGEGEALARIELPGGPGAESAGYHFHPALLDAALQVVGAIGPTGEPGTPLVPVAVELARWSGRPCAPRWSHGSVHPVTPGGTTLADVTLFDESGRMVAELIGVAFRPLRREALNVGPGDDRLFRVEWQAKTTLPHPATHRGRWLLVSDGHGIGGELAAALRDRGSTAILAGNEADPRYEQLLTGPEAGAGWAGIVHLRSLESDAAPDAADVDLAPGCRSLLYLLQTVIAAGAARPPRLWVVTRGAQPAGPTGAVPTVTGAAVWGMARSLALEHPEFRVGIADLDPADDPRQAALLAEEVLADGPGDQVAFRAGRRYVARLTGGPALADAPGLRPDGTYLITGGLGGVARHLAGWLVHGGARHLVLAGRREPDEAAADVIRQLEYAGARVRVERVDVADREQVAGLLDRVARAGPPLRGVFHAALVLSDGLLLNQVWDDFRRALPAKVSGAWNLHLLTRGLELDHFVLFSSVASVLGMPGQANYSAASAFLDALANHRRSSGLPGLSVNWGPWDFPNSAGAAAVADQRQQYRGFRPLPPAEALDLLGRVLRADSPQVGIAPFDRPAWCRLYPTAGGSLLAGECRVASAAPRSGEDGTRLWAAPPAERRAIVEAYLRKQLAGRLGIAPDRLGPNQVLTALGLDSLVVLEVRNRILTDLRVAVPPVAFLERATLARLTDAVMARINPPPPAGEAPPNGKKQHTKRPSRLTPAPRTARPGTR